MVRDSDQDVEDDAEDMVRAVETALKRRRRGEVIRLKMSAGAPDELRALIMEELAVTEDEVVEMNRRLSGGDASLNAQVGSDGDGSTQWQDWLEDEDSDQAADYDARDELDTRRALRAQAMSALTAGRTCARMVMASAFCAHF